MTDATRNGRWVSSALSGANPASLEKMAPLGMFIVLGLSVLGLFGWLFRPAYRAIGHVINALGIG